MLRSNSKQSEKSMMWAAASAAKKPVRVISLLYRRLKTEVSKTAKQVNSSQVSL